MPPGRVSFARQNVGQHPALIHQTSDIVNDDSSDYDHEDASVVYQMNSRQTTAKSRVTDIHQVAQLNQSASDQSIK